VPSFFLLGLLEHNTDVSSDSETWRREGGDVEETEATGVERW
jgi:hypothetical protein